ncbi:MULTISPECIES: endonuclease I family protein [Bhargavaea]|uniref:Endonuclease I family protein n=1 Tax=Bhargavaea changchunensis TaxID=2134037 RepID=A0ABW2NEB1_9BACL|nr:endonuclease [Bhargavaea sp. CC-171006]
MNVSIRNEIYYDTEKDLKVQEDYYSEVDFGKENLPEQIHSLLLGTHTRPLNYSPHQYVYPWVDLQENGKLKSLYSGASLDPIETINQDLKLLQIIRQGGVIASEKLMFNTEHVVPQSWFDEKEPMRGDLHHLFACEPACNSMRSNYPYHDFESYVPEFQADKIRSGCGMAEEGKFEPEYGKGIVARAVFYFDVRYKDGFRMEDKMDLELLLRWHEEHPVDVYERHRNAAIQELQGNRNPFIDFPERAGEMLGI